MLENKVRVINHQDGTSGRYFVQSSYNRQSSLMTENLKVWGTPNGVAWEIWRLRRVDFELLHSCKFNFARLYREGGPKTACQLVRCFSEPPSRPCNT